MMYPIKLYFENMCLIVSVGRFDCTSRAIQKLMVMKHLIIMKLRLRRFVQEQSESSFISPIIHVCILYDFSPSCLKKFREHGSLVTFSISMYTLCHVFV
jgi:hypothetical protein